jgi:outer membrane biogenesis lipoprotein LolB
MKFRPHTFVTTAFAFLLLAACGKQAENETANTTAAPVAQESAANASGTTTYYGDNEQQPATSNN